MNDTAICQKHVTKRICCDIIYSEKYFRARSAAEA